jgi:hypothetical protein
LRARAIDQKLRMRAAQFTGSAPVSGAWVSLGPLPLPSDASGSGLEDYGFVAGRATAVAIDPNDLSGNTVFLGGAFGGVWKSSNAADLSLNPSSVTWIPLTDSQATLAIGAIAIQPQSSNPNPASSIVLAGTGETDSSTDSYYGLGILRSADGGQNWSLISQDSAGTHSFAGVGFSQIAFSTTNPNLVVAAAGAASQGLVEGLEDPEVVNRGLYYSSDAGLHWQAATVSDSGTAISPSSATSVVYNAAAGMFYAAIRFHGFYSSPDGANWSRLASQPGAGLTVVACPAQAAESSGCPIYRGEIAVLKNRAGPSGLGEMYVWYVDANDSDQGIWQSLDGGATWLQINDTGITNCGDVFGGCGTEQRTFNLALAAVPNGDTATDLYAGAVNIYKCQITAAFPACNGTGASTFQNLTHAYGCSAIAKVHPGQHAIDSLISNGAALMFFANNGGIYRALDAYTGLTTGSCSGSNQFDNLNQTLGPITQFVSVAQSASDVNMIFGGTQDNGAPATAFSQSGGDWVNVNAGDNGFTAINPANENEWFVATPPSSISGVNLFRCESGIACHSLDFENNTVADSSMLDGDTGSFYFPFLVDPQSASEVILGTCRIWRGPTSGGNFLLLSPDFENGGNGSCSGREINLVRSIAAGGLRNPNGYSQTIYAGTNGEGPLIPTAPAGGRVWVTTNADGGPLTWTDVTQSINPQFFPISSIALDSTDPPGHTAYLAIMGFHTSHVWKTTNAGASWIDFTANLPDAPVNAIIVGSGASLSNGTVYVGTDVGVFASSTGSANWTEIGPPSGLAGFLPNLSVTSLQIFNAGGNKRLRAATYGRGIWEWNLITTPDFEIIISNNPQTVLAGQTATFSGAVFALNGYGSNVNLGCTSGATSPPQTCSIIPAALAPTSAGASFVLSAEGAPGDYQFNLHAVGTDPAKVTHDFALTLHNADFMLSTPSPPSITATPGATSGAASFQVGAVGNFTGGVALSCSGLPSGAACEFQPSSSISPVAGSPVSVTLNISTASSTPTGNFPITITAGTPGEPAKSANLALIVSSSPDYTISIANTSLSTSVGKAVSFNGKLTAANGYNSAVALACGVGAPSTCTPNPASATPSSAGTPFTVTVSSNLAQAYNFNIVATGTDAATISHSVPVSFTATPTQSFNFTISPDPKNATTVAGNAANFMITISPDPPANSFPAGVNLSCSHLPPLTTCSFSALESNGNSGSQQSTLIISTTAPVAASITAPMMPFVAVFPAAAVIFLSRRKFKPALQTSLLLALFAFTLASLSCGGGLQGGNGGMDSPGTPAGTYNITVTAACCSVSPSPQTVVSLQVTP